MPSKPPKWLKLFLNSHKKAVKEAIQVHVNGKIDDMDRKLGDYIKVDIEWKKEDKEWKDNAQRYREEKLEPIVQTSDKFKLFGGGIKFVATTLILIASTAGATIYIFKLFR